MAVVSDTHARTHTHRHTHAHGADDEESWTPHTCDMHEVICAERG